MQHKITHTDAAQALVHRHRHVQVQHKRRPGEAQVAAVKGKADSAKISAGIFKQSMGARNRIGIWLSYQPAIHRLEAKLDSAYTQYMLNSIPLILSIS